MYRRDFMILSVGAMLTACTDTKIHPSSTEQIGRSLGRIQTATYQFVGTHWRPVEYQMRQSLHTDMGDMASLFSKLSFQDDTIE